ncbi:hypothetical protein [Pseudonocardia abyssalis]|uniref:DUF4386 family protein n=1 Tax=Pseudonocardia abyssalis TaxID=2792008 RepID=A0ABS6UW72_9PSEU|nr:hypothetical protein [Pseudonocardia abyssalis]MBW0115677.1 hypothetical protein [Pseudonocardia abyssalis]MBW0136427.1 hypothetical protein [Pseudonocardia abyssalis]
MPHRSDTAGAVAFAAAGALFVLYPAVRPYGDLDPAATAAAFASPAWLVAHLAAVAAFLLTGFGLVALTRRDRGLGPATGLWWTGAGLTIAYYGAETFALHALGGRVTDPEQLAALAEAVRMGPVQTVVFGVGLVTMAVSAVRVAVALRRDAVLFAAGMVLFLPQFFAPPGLRIAHGVLLGAGCVVLAVRLATTRAAQEPASLS